MPRVAKLVAALRAQVTAGEPLPSALARFPRDVFRRSIADWSARAPRPVACPTCCARLADYLEARLGAAAEIHRSR